MNDAPKVADAGEVPEAPRCWYCDQQCCDHRHGSGSACGDCCAAHGSTTHLDDEIHGWISKCLSAKNERLYSLEAENRQLKEQVRKLSAPVSEKEETPCEEPEGKCNQPAGMALSPFHWFCCVLPKGHEGEHQRGGTCMAHGEYVGENCPEWPTCITILATRTQEPAQTEGKSSTFSPQNS